jgi:hypothetical protein
MALNKKLFKSLVRTFGDAKIAKESTSMAFHIAKDPLTGKNRFLIDYSGEEYRVCCPFCTDTRYRLWINHRWNTTDPATQHYFGVGQICCFNDNCDINQYASRDERRTCHDNMVNRMKPYIARGMGLTVKPVAKRRVVVAQLPPKCWPLDTLPENHAAVKYLASEQFEPFSTAVDWQLQYCPDDENPNVANRIVIPIYWEDKLVGFQARYLAKSPPSDNIPKYYTMPGTPKRQILYNYDRAKTTRFGVIVEGATDVWRIGRQGVAFLGNSVSEQQARIISATWARTGICLMIDPDLIHKKREKPHRPTEYEKIRELLMRPGLFEWGVLEVVLPQGTDPGSFPSKTALWEYIIGAANAQGYNHEILDVL